MAANRTVLVIGATGHFGARICKRLAGISGVHLVVSSRDAKRAEKFATQLQAGNAAAQISAIACDQSSPALEDDIRGVDPLVVVHTAGPYQGQDYGVANACLNCRCHYVDLADGRDFVMNFSSLNDSALQQDVLLVTGASTLPALSGAVIDKLRPDFARLESIDISIAPGHQTPRGGGTVAAVLSYCGRPIKTLRDGQSRTVYGWQDWRLCKYPHMRRRIGGACDVPDLRLIPALIPELQSMSFHAALEAPWEQAALWLMAGLTRLGIVDDWQFLAASFRRLGERLIRLGSDTGAMHVRLRGSGLDGQRLTRTWYVTAPHNHGPEIPCVPAIIIVKKLLSQQMKERGAMHSYGLISLDEFERETSEFGFEYDIVNHGAGDMPTNLS